MHGSASPSAALAAQDVERRRRSRASYFENYVFGNRHKCEGARCWCSHLTCSRQRVCHRNFQYACEWDWAPSQQWDKPNPHSPAQHGMRASQVQASLDVGFTSICACR